MEDKAVRRALCEFIRELAVTQRAVEVQREVLAEGPAFDLQTAFKSLAQGNSDCLTSADILAFMQRLKFKIDERGASELTRALSQTGDISFDEFSKAVSPAGGLAPQADPSQELTYETEYALARVLSKQLEGIKNVEFCRQDLERQPQGVAKAYNMLAGSTLQGVTRDGLYAFISNYTTDLSLDDVTVVFDSIDKDKDGLISFKEFVDIAGAPRPLFRIEAKQVTNLPEKPIVPKFEASQVESLSPIMRSPMSNRSYYTIGSESPKKREGSAGATPSSWKPVSFSDMPSTALKLPFLLGQLMQKECEANKIQQQLTAVASFSPQSVFRLFDTKNYGNITLAELKRGLQATHIQADQRSLKLLFMRHDRDSDGRLSFSDFLPIIVPADYESSPNGSQELTRDALIVLGRLFLLHQKNESGLEDLRASLSPTELHKLYATLTRSSASSTEQSPAQSPSLSSRSLSGEAGVDEVRLKQLVESSGLPASDSQINILMKRLDYDADGTISFADFLESFSRKLPR